MKKDICLTEYDKYLFYIFYNEFGDNSDQIFLNKKRFL